MSESIKLEINGKTFTVTLADTDAARTLSEILPLELDMTELNGNEKYFYLDRNLPTQSEQVVHIKAGDLMLYGSNCIVLFYKEFLTGYSYTRLGTIDDSTDLAQTLGEGDVSVKFSDFAATVTEITNYYHNSLVSGTSGDDSIENHANNVTIQALGGNDYVINYGDDPTVIKDSYHGRYALILADAGDDTIYNNGIYSTIDGGAGNDYISNSTWGINSTITGGTGDDYILNGGSKSKIFGGDGNDSIQNTNYGEGASIYGNAGNDYLTTYYSDSVLLDGGADNDSINLWGEGSKITVTGGLGNDSVDNENSSFIFNYVSGDGDDSISGFNATSTLSISGSSYSTAKSGSDIIVTVGTGKITLKGAASLSALNILGTEEIATLLTVTNSTTSPLTLDAAVKNVNASKRTKAVKITGNKLANSISGGTKGDSIYGGAGADTILGNAGNDKLFGEGGNDKLLGGAGADTLSGGKGNDTFTGGAGADVFVYTSGKDVITDYAEADKISIAGTAGVTTSGSNVVFTIGTGKITVKNAADKIITYIDSDGEHIFPEDDGIKISGKTVTLTENFTQDSFSIANDTTLQTIDASAVQLALSISGNKLKNKIIGSSEDDSINGLAGADTINGGAGNDTILGGKGNDSLRGGNGSDIFVYNSGDGNDVIADYAQEDRILITSGTANVTTSGNNVILTVGSGKITVKGAKDKVVTYIDSTGTNYYPKDADPVILSGNGVTLRANYSKALYSLGAKILTIDASDVTRDLKIMGNGLANDIFGGSGNDSINGGAGKDTIDGGAGNDTLLGGTGNDEIFGGEGDDVLIGGAGKDTLWGNEGSDIFYYSKGGGNDVIFGFSDDDTLTLDNLNFTATHKNGVITFKAGSTSNAITLKEFTATTFHVNGETYKLKGTSLVRS
ncbi:MAG: hypothetical protein IJL14_01545 [Selenomonadaceae bacterium]|nr:hypothetical protein [Selenomonadaceae bacterium]